MFVKRLFPNRWARIIAWTGAAIAWSSVAVATIVKNEPAPPSEQEAATPVEPAVATTSTSVAVPAVPENGLVVIRYTPVPPPKAEVVTRTVTVSGPSGTSGGGAKASPPPPKVESKGS
jgi:hypothetical protein